MVKENALSASEELEKFKKEHLFNLVQDEPVGFWRKISRHLSRYRNRYIIIGSYTLLTFGFCALCAFCPPVAAAIPIVLLITKVLVAIKFLHIAAAVVTPVAKAITMALPIMIPQAIALTSDTIGAVATLFYGGFKLCQGLAAKIMGKSDIKPQITYKPVTTDSSLSTDSVALPSSTLEREPVQD